MSLINPITGESVDQIITEKEAKERGYLEFAFILQNLEDENESVMLFEVEGQRILVERSRVRYKKGTDVNQERVLATVVDSQIGERRKEAAPVSPTSCSLDDGCINCGS